MDGVVNITGGGPNPPYASVRSLTVDSKIAVYTCPDISCVVATQTEFDDVLPTTGSSAWSHQLDVPAGGLRGNPVARQPPTVRAIASVSTASATYNFDGYLEPFWTWSNNEMANLIADRDDAGRDLSCFNSSFPTPDLRCATWGEPGGVSAVITFELSSSLGTANGTANLTTDMQNVVLPAWNQPTARSPRTQACFLPCAEKVLVSAVPGGDIGFDKAQTGATGNAAIPAVLDHGTMKINKDIAWDWRCRRRL